MTAAYPHRAPLERLGHDGFALTKAQALAMHDEIDRLRAENVTLWDNLADREDEIALLTTEFQGLCGEIGHVWCTCTIPCHIGCKRCDHYDPEDTP